MLQQACQLVYFCARAALELAESDYEQRQRTGARPMLRRYIARFYEESDPQDVFTAITVHRDELILVQPFVLWSGHLFNLLAFFRPLASRF